MPEAPVPAVSPEVTAHHPISLQLPSSIRGGRAETFRSPGYAKLPVSVPPCTPELEKILLDALISELNETFMTALATEYCTMRDGAAGTEQHEDWSFTRYIFVGASHASRLASAMREAGAEVADISVPGWRVSEANVEHACELLKEVLEEDWEDDTVIVYQLFDNSSFMYVGPDGTSGLPFKSTEDGKYHVPGAIGLIDRDDFKQIFSQAVPLLRAGGQHKKVLLSPLMRYTLEGCCTDEAHCTNRKTFYPTMFEQLAEIETWMDDQSYLKRIRKYCVLNPNSILTPDLDKLTKKDKTTFKQFWSAGPVHMTGTGYEYLATKLTEEIGNANFKRDYVTQQQAHSVAPTLAVGRGRGQYRGRGHFRGQGKLDQSSRRQKWISGNDVVANRSYRDETSGRGRGKSTFRGRGGRG
jgi:hypothetical protein